MDTFKEFYLLRLEDESGVSGVGVVARGVVLPSGKVVLEWQTFHSSLGLYQNLSDVESIHGHGGKTQVVMGNPHDKDASIIRAGLLLKQAITVKVTEVPDMANKPKKPKKPKPRIPVAPPGKRHKTKKDYKRVKKVNEDHE